MVHKSVLSTMRGGESVAGQLAIAVRLEKKAVFAKTLLLLLTVILASLSVLVIAKTNSSFGKIKDVISEMETAGRNLDESEASSLKAKEFAIFYVAILVSSTAAVLHVIGFLGAIFENAFALRFYSLFMFGFMVASSVIATAWIATAEQRTMVFLRDFYKLYLETYYLENHESFLDIFIDDVQRSNECCGYYTYPSQAEDYDVYLTMLYFMEMTKFGQKQAGEIGWDNSGTLNFVPKSCCLKPGEGCASDTYGSRIYWNATKAKVWRNKIYKVGCRDFLDNLWLVIMNTAVSIALLIEVLLTVLAVLLAFYCARELQRNAMMVPSIEKRVYARQSFMESVFGGRSRARLQSRGRSRM